MKSSEPLIKSMGFDQFQEYRQEMLARYNSEKRKAANDPVRVWHGEVAEAEFRRWLRAFLPEKFGVTKGSVVFPKVGNFYQLPEYDIIIYDKSEALVLWHRHPSGQLSDDTIKGIRAKDVYAVFEVKATLTLSHAQDAVHKVEELESEAMAGLMKPGFFSGVIFFELRLEDQRTSSILDRLVPPKPLTGYLGGLVLSAENDTSSCSGRIRIDLADASRVANKLAIFKDLHALKFKHTPGKIKMPPQGAVRLQVLSDDDFLGDKQGRNKKEDEKYHWYYERGYAVHSSTVPWSAGFHAYASLSWSRSAFSRFASEIAERLKGSYRPGRVSDLHGLLFDDKL